MKLSTYRKTLLLYIFVLIASWKIQEAVALCSNAHKRSSTAFTKLNAALSSFGPSSSNILCTSDTRDPLLSVNSLQNNNINTNSNDCSTRCKYSVCTKQSATTRNQQVNQVFPFLRYIFMHAPAEHLHQYKLW